MVKDTVCDTQTSSEKTLASALLSPGSLTQRKTSTMLQGHPSSPREVCLVRNWGLPPTANTNLSDMWVSHFASRSSNPNWAFRWLHQFSTVQFSSVQSLSHVQLFATPWTATCQASLSATNPQSLLKLMSIESVMPSSQLILCRPLLLLPSMFPSIRVFANESVLCIRWPKYWSFTFNISPSNEYSDWFPLGWTGWISLQSKGLSRVFSNTTNQKHQFFCAQLSLWSSSLIHTWLLEKHFG